MVGRWTDLCVGTTCQEHGFYPKNHGKAVEHLSVSWFLVQQLVLIMVERWTGEEGRTQPGHSTVLPDTETEALAGSCDEGHKQRDSGCGEANGP